MSCPLKPYPPQVECIDAMVRALRARGFVINKSCTGTGKTLVTIETARILGFRPLVVCPAIVVTQWKRAMEAQGVVDAGIYSWEKIRRGNTPFYSKHPRIPRSRVALGRWTLPDNSVLVLDESHKAKTYRSQSNIMALSAAVQKIPSILLSATPFITPLDMSVPATYAGWIRDPRIGFWMWARQQGCTESFWGGLEFKLSTRTQSLMENLKRKLFDAGVMTEIDREKLDTFFPKNRIEYLSVDVEVGGMKRIKALQKALDKLDNAWAESIERASENGVELPAVVELLRLRQQSELAKLPTMAEKAVELLESGYSVAIFVSFLDSIQTLSELICQKAEKEMLFSEISGRLTGTERQEEVDKFQSNRTRVALVQISAGGTGVSLHDTDGNFPRAALISPDYSIQNLLQAQGRIARLGARSSTIQYIVTAADTVEEKIIKALNTKEICFNSLTLNDSE